MYIKKYTNTKQIVEPGIPGGGVLIIKYNEEEKNGGKRKQIIKGKNQEIKSTR